MKVIRITCSIRQDQELHVESLNNCISELKQQAYDQRLALQDAQYGFVESRREQVRVQEEISMKEKVIRNTEIRDVREMGESKKAQELPSRLGLSAKIK